MRKCGPGIPAQADHRIPAQADQDDRKGRPYYTTDRLVKPVYSRDDPCGRPGREANRLLLFRSSFQ